MVWVLSFLIYLIINGKLRIFDFTNVIYMNLSAIPDSIDKIILLIGVVIIYFGFNSRETIQNEHQSATETVYQLQDSVKTIQTELKFVQDHLIRKSNEISAQLGLDNPITFKNGQFYFQKSFNSSKNENELTQLLIPYWDDFGQEEKRLTLFSSNLLNKAKINRNVIDDYPIEISSNNNYIAVGVIIFIIGFVLMFIQSNKNNKLFYYTIREKGEISNYCQSCSKKFNSIVTPGSNSNGSINYSFCKECYFDGNFVKSNDQAFEDIIFEINSDGNLNENEKKAAIKKMSNRERWKPNKY